jgi:uncharacterized membrane protein
MGTLQASRTVEIEAPVEKVYGIIEDLENTPDWQQSMVSLEVLERDSQDRPTLCEIVSDAKIRQVTSQIRFAHHPPNEMTWEQEKGQMKWLEGRWELEDLGDGRTKATYSLESDPGRVLGLLLRGPVEGQVKEFLTKDPTEGLKRAAESG